MTSHFTRKPHLSHPANLAPRYQYRYPLPPKGAGLPCLEEFATLLECYQRNSFSKPKCFTQMELYTTCSKNV